MGISCDFSWDFDGISNGIPYGIEKTINNGDMISVISHGCILLAHMISEKKGGLARSIFGGHEFS